MLLLKRILLFSLPLVVVFIILGVAELNLPANLFYFRVWESIAFHTLPRITFGAFYPDQSITRTETGDLGAHTVFAVPKQVVWQTDSFGFRYIATTTKFDVVVMGDSFIAGTGLTQSEMFTSDLQRLLNRNVYPYAPVNINSFVNDARFKNNPPQLVIFTAAEKTVSSLPNILPENSLKRKAKLYFEKIFFSNKILFNVMLTLDRLSKNPIIHLIQIRTSPLYGLPQAIVAKGRLYETTYKGYQNDNEKNFQQSLATLKEYSDYFKSQGIPLAVMIIPDKENIEHTMLGDKAPTFLSDFNNALQNAGITVIDVEPAFHNTNDRLGQSLYLSDDTHWDAEGAKVAASTTADFILNKKF